MFTFDILGAFDKVSQKSLATSENNSICLLIEAGVCIGIAGISYNQILPLVAKRKLHNSFPFTIRSGK